jgi:hypothetical protein
MEEQMMEGTAEQLQQSSVGGEKQPSLKIKLKRIEHTAAPNTILQHATANQGEQNVRACTHTRSCSYTAADYAQTATV